MLEEEPSGQSIPPSGDDKSWQAKLLPLMRITLVVFAFFFFLISCVQLVFLNREILNASTIDIQQSLIKTPIQSPHQTFSEDLAARRLDALVLLEANATSAQYHQAGVLLASRLWTTYLGFVTGMILAFVGATFVLGRLQEDSSELNTTAGKVQMSFKSASPGLMLAVLGVILMVCTIVTHNEILTTHGATYLSEATATPQTTDSETPTPARTGTESSNYPGKTAKPPALVLPKPQPTTQEKR